VDPDRIDFMRDNIRSYDDPANFDITNRPTPKELTIGLWATFFLSGIPGALILPLLYTWIVAPAQMSIVLIFAVIGMGIGMGAYFPMIKRRGIRKRREFIDVGGDPSEYSDLQCGVLGGSKTRNGGWQWTFPSTE
jgi:hypothetical protein